MRYPVIQLCGLSLLLLSGCASQTLKGYVGQPVSEVVATKGMPNADFSTGTDTRAFVWQTTEQGQTTPTTITSTKEKDYGTGNWNQITTIEPSQTETYQCAYVVYAKKADNGIDGPAGWIITSYKKPDLSCEGGF